MRFTTTGKGNSVLLLYHITEVKKLRTELYAYIIIIISTFKSPTNCPPQGYTDVTPISSIYHSANRYSGHGIADKLLQ